MFRVGECNIAERHMASDGGLRGNTRVVNGRQKAKEIVEVMCSLESLELSKREESEQIQYNDKDEFTESRS